MTILAKLVITQKCRKEGVGFTWLEVLEPTLWKTSETALIVTVLWMSKAFSLSLVKGSYFGNMCFIEM